MTKDVATKVKKMVVLFMLFSDVFYERSQRNIKGFPAENIKRSQGTLRGI